MSKIWRIRRDDERGAILVISTVGFVLAVIAAALAVDLGTLAQERRRDQKVADLAALDAARNLGAVDLAAKDSAARNGFPTLPKPGYDVTAVLGDKVGGVCQAGAGPGGRVCVTVTSPHKNNFVPGDQVIQARAVATLAPPQASFMVGASVATLDTSRSAILDSVLGQFLDTPSAVNVGLVGYKGLASSAVTLGALGEELTTMGVTFGSPQELLDANVSMVQVLRATANALRKQTPPKTAEATILDTLAAQIGPVPNIKLGQFIGLGPSAVSAMEASLNAFGILMGGATVANGTNAVTIPVTGISIPGLGGVTLAANAIEGPSIGIGGLGTSRTNTQATVTLNVKVNVTVLGITLTGVNIPITINGGVATATINAIRCNTGTDGLDLGVVTSGVTNSGSATVELLGTQTLAISGSTGGTSANLIFDYPSEFGIDQGQIQHVGGTGLGNPPTISGSGPGLTGGLLATAVQTIVNALYPVLNPLLAPVLEAIGLDVGAADVAALALIPPPPTCGGNPILVK